MGGVCRINSNDCTAQTAKECQEGIVGPTATASRAWLSGGLSMLGGETVALDQGRGIEILMSKKVVVQI
jgi:hypothetical protein